MKRFFIRMACVAAFVAFASAGICADAGAPQKEPTKTGIIDRIKKAYGDFRDRDKKKEAAKEVVKPKEALPKAVRSPDAQPQAPKSVETPLKADKVKMTKEEMLSDIKDDLEAVDEIFDSIPGLKAQKDEAGKIFYIYNGVKLEEMKEEELQGLFTKVGQSATRFRTERIQRQLETVRRTQQLTERATPARAVTPSGPPSVSIPPSPPSLPRSPSQPPQPSISRPPSTPSAPPSTRR